MVDMYGVKNGWVGRDIDGVRLEFPFGTGLSFTKEQILDYYKDRLPAGHVVLEQVDMMDGRVSQTVRDTKGREYERIVHADEAYGYEA